MTIKELAKLANVSTKTISRVVNNEKYVSEETRNKVLEIINKNNYRPNIYAQSLRKKTQKNILVSILKNKNSHIPQWIEILITELVEHGNNLGYSVIMETYSSFEDIENISMINSTSDFLDGVIVFYEKQNDPRIQLLKKNKIPYIIFDKPYDEESPYVTNDDYNAMFEGVTYLLSRQLKNIQIFLGKETPTNLEREKGAIDAFIKANIDLKYLKIKYNIYNIKMAYDYSLELIKNKEIPEVFLISGDEKVLGVYKAIFENNLKIPNDISVMGFDNIPNSEFYYPSLTTIKQDYQKMAAAIFNYFIFDYKKEKIIKEKIPTKIILRESVR